MEALTPQEVRQLIRRRAQAAGSMTRLARQVGLHDSTLPNIVSGRVEAGPVVRMKLGIDAVIEAEPAPVSAPVEPETVVASTYEPMWRFGDWPVFRRRRGAR